MSQDEQQIEQQIEHQVEARSSEQAGGKVVEVEHQVKGKICVGQAGSCDEIGIGIEIRIGDGTEAEKRERGVSLA